MNDTPSQPPIHSRGNVRQRPAVDRGPDRPGAAIAAVTLFFSLAAIGPAAATEGTEARPSAARGDGLAEREATLLAQYRDLERSFLRLADLLATSDPRQAKLLRTAFERAREAQVGERLEAVVGLLEKGQLLKAGTDQQAALERLRELLELLSKTTAADRRAGVKQEVRELLARLGKLLARQRDVEGATESGADSDTLADRQRSLADDTRRLADDSDAFSRRVDDRQPAASPPPTGDQGTPPPADSGPPQGGTKPPAAAPPQEGGSPPNAAPTPGDGQPPTGESPGSAADAGDSPAGEPEPSGDDDAARARRAAARLRAAEARMRAAHQRLDTDRRAEARREQERAAEELETARAELDEILRQLREQEVEQLLVQLEARVRDMLRAERTVLTSAERMAGDGQAVGRERELEAARLAREQAAIGGEASKALILVRDDGTAVVIPQALESIRDDATQAAERLGRGDFGNGTCSMLTDIVTGLEELLAALERGRQEGREGTPPAGGGRSGEPSARPLVDRLAELRMLRSLQLRVNARTHRLSALLAEGSERAVEPDLRAALARLAERQQAIERAARDIVAGRTE